MSGGSWLHFLGSFGNSNNSAFLEQPLTLRHLKNIFITLLSHKFELLSNRSVCRNTKTILPFSLTHPEIRWWKAGKQVATCKHDQDFFFLPSVFQMEQQLRPLHEGTNLNPKTPTSRCVKSPLFFVHSTMASNYSTAFISSSTLRVEAEQMLPILFSIYHRLKFNLSWCGQHFLLQYAYILALWFACCAAFMLPGGGRSRWQISSLAHSLLNYQLEFISLEDNNSHSARRMSPVLLLFASAVAVWHRHCREKWAAYAPYKPRDTLGHFVRRQTLHKPNKPDGLLNSSIGCILRVHLGQNRVENLWDGGGYCSGESWMLIG